MRPVIVKLGGSVITDKSRKFRVRRRILERIADEIAECGEELIVVHGGGSFGHPVAKEYGLTEGFKNERQLKGFVLTHLAMVKLNQEIVKTFAFKGIPAVPVQPSACMVVSDGRIVEAELRPLRNMLSLGLLPVLFGDVVPDERRGFTILSGDQIVSFLAISLKAKRVVVGVDVDGVYTANPKISKSAELLKEIAPVDLKRMSFGESSTDVTGGMYAKVSELFLPAKKGINVQIVNAMKPGILARAIKGETNLGTVVKAR
ncbi:MAG: isopentenyl phosphate kinase [Candidatus Hadarchaeales archaeon]